MLLINKRIAVQAMIRTTSVVFRGIVLEDTDQYITIKQDNGKLAQVMRKRVLFIEEL